MWLSSEMMALTSFELGALTLGLLCDCNSVKKLKMNSLVSSGSDIHRLLAGDFKL